MLKFPKKSIHFACRMLVIFLLGLSSIHLNAQEKLTVDKVYSAYLRSSGTISAQGQIKGYYFLYMSDKIDRHTNEYTLQILDENLNKVNNIVFQDTRKLTLLESAYNGGSLSFLFKNEDSKTLDMKIFDLSGQLKYTYTREFDKRTDDLMNQYATQHTDEGMNKNVFDLGEQGFVSVLPMRDGKQRTYEVDYYSSGEKKQWTYVPNDDDEKYAFAEYLGSTDSLILLGVLKRNSKNGNPSAHLVGLNFVTKKKMFDIDNANEEYKIQASNISDLKNGSFLLMGTFYDQDQNIAKDFSRGLAIYQISTSGKIMSKVYNTWAGDFARFLPTDRKGKVEGVGYLYVHKLLRTPENKIFVVGEGYKRQVSAGGIGLTALAALGGGTSTSGVTKIVITDMIIMEFNNQFKVKNATIYDKANNTALAGPESDYVSQHALASYLKAVGAFDYEFTTGELDNSRFAVCYSDYVRSSDYKGLTFNAIRYNGSKFNTDKIELKSKASSMRVFPAKAGSVMIMEYFKKDKKLEFRLEKIG